MKKKIFTVLLLIVLSSLLWFVNLEYLNPYIEKTLYTFLAILCIYVLFKVFFEQVVGAQVREAKAKYHFKKALSTVYPLFIIIAVFTIWIENPQALLVAYGLLAAGVAVSLQDVFRNLAGGITLFLTGIYGVGDRIEINSKYGDVIDVGILYTTLQELGEWISGEQATGRITIIPNGYVLSNTVNNYTRDNRFMWDEITVPVTYDSDWHEALTRINNIVEAETSEVTRQAAADKSIKEKRYYLPESEMKPAIYVKLTDNWIEFKVRYLTGVRERRAVRDRINRLILEEIERNGKIKMASTTIEVVKFPPIELNKKNI
ncbi:MAG: mechanosensitive ion channel [Candidatus Altiarchaeota archaeon]|nr:mechanosensitive ion channel [Candidatus Altiarchaeota archaeon]